MSRRKRYKIDGGLNLPNTVHIARGSGEWEPHFISGLPPGYTAKRKKGRNKGPYLLIGPQGEMGEFSAEEKLWYRAKLDYDSRHQPAGQCKDGDAEVFDP